MATITTEGGSGTTTSSVGATTGASVTLFTTPNTANGIFKVTWFGSIDAQTASIGASPNGIYIAGSIINPQYSDGTTNQPVAPTISSSGTIIVGPNTAVIVPVYNNTSSSKTFRFTYHYIGIVIS